MIQLKLLLSHISERLENDFLMAFVLIYKRVLLDLEYSIFIATVIGRRDDRMSVIKKIGTRKLKNRKWK